MTEQLLSPGVLGYENDQSFYTQGVSTTGLALVGPTEKGAAYVPTDVTTFSQFTAIFGSDTKTNYTTQTAYNYLQSGNVVKVVRVLGNGGWQYSTTKQLAAITSGSYVLSVIYPTQNENVGAALNGVTASGTFSSFTLQLSGSFFPTKTYGLSLDPTSATYVPKVLGTDATYQTGSVFPYLMFGNFITGSGALSTTSSISSSIKVSTSNCTFTSSNASGYDHASTPWILSNSGVRLFKIHHISDGFKTNRDVKVAIAGINPGDSSIYTTFNVVVRAWNDTDRNPSIIEQFVGVSLDPNSASYIANVIGDKYMKYDASQAAVIEEGDYSNKSNYIRVEVADGVDAGSILPELYPNGYEAIYETIAGFSGFNLPAAVNISSNTGSFVYSGFDYSNPDNINYLNPVPSEAGAGLNTAFTKPVNDDKFFVPMQGGTDGMNFVTIKKIGDRISTNGTNVFGYDLSNSGAAGYASYKIALDAINNPEEHRFDLLAVPGVIDEYHGAVTAYAQATAESRTDCVYIRDITGINSTVAAAVSIASGLDSSYSSAYFPWVKVRDIGSNKTVLVPPSVAIPEVYAYNDRVSAEWFAPAGLSRGLVGAVDVRFKLKVEDRNKLYQAKINPIVKFPNTGVVVWGQKTLQIQDTALNRINVRRLLINLRNYIGDLAKNFVFENNTIQTRNKLVNRIVPYMENVQTREGLYAFRVQIDEALNTNDVIDRNMLVGKIYVSPAKSIEFIILEFNVTPTGGITF